MGETVLTVQNGIRCWPRRKPLLVFGTYLGTIIITNQRFLFLSTGGSNFKERLIAGALGRPGGMSIKEQVLTQDLDLSTLHNKGSLEIALDRIDYFEVQGGLWRAPCLLIKFRESTGLARSSYFSYQGAEQDNTGLHNLRTSIEKAKVR